MFPERTAPLMLKTYIRKLSSPSTIPSVTGVTLTEFVGRIFPFLNETTPESPETIPFETVQTGIPERLKSALFASFFALAFASELKTKQ